jgi:hypothetical protein
VHFFIISPLSFRAENNPDQISEVCQFRGFTWWSSWHLLSWLLVIARGHMQVYGDERTRRTWERISASSKLVLGHGYRGWKALKEHNGIETPNEGIDSPTKRENLSPHRGCVTNWYQSMVTTLGLLGLMQESYENIFGGI